MKIGSTEQLSGFVTRQINLQGQTLEEIERRIGYHKGRLAAGAYFLVATELPSPKGYNLAGYSQVAAHHTNEKYQGINNPNDSALERKKAMASSNWGLSGSDRLIKVLAVIRHDEKMKDDDQYPAGSGIQQWKLTQKIKFVVEDIVLNYPNGRFIPKQGFKEVKYF